MENEIWKDVLGYEGYYQVSNLGNVKTMERICISGTYNSKRKIEEKNLKKAIHKDTKYEQVGLGNNGKIKSFYVHRLVAIAFISNPENKKEVNHINGIRNDNNLSNLEWCTRTENARHAYDVLKVVKIGTMLGKFGDKHNRSKPVYQYSTDGLFIKRYGSAKEAYRETGLFDSSISNCANGKAKSCGGFIWKRC